MNSTTLSPTHGQATLSAQFDAYAAWRTEFAAGLKRLTAWLKHHGLMDEGITHGVQQLEAQVRSDKVMIAFVAEFSRGKSELINAIFFAHYGRRIMPASAGRTTMCPTELSWNAAMQPCMRLLPIETRLQPRSFMQWRETDEQWLRIELDVHDADLLARTFAKVSEVIRVTVEQAKALGFWHDDMPDDNPPKDAQGMVEVPRWRHALINIAHPLLEQGLVILDTPGLNAIGAEPELTVNLISQAQAVVFILAADAGVTKSDRSLWNDHLITDASNYSSRLVVLNKIDVLWDSLSTHAQIHEMIDRQRKQTADILNLPSSQVMAVSAQKALVAKVKGDERLLRASQIEGLEQALSDAMLSQRKRILQSAVGVSVAQLHKKLARQVDIRRGYIVEQLLEMQGLRGKNAQVIKHMRARIEAEKSEFKPAGQRVHAVRSVHQSLLREAILAMSERSLDARLRQFGDALNGSRTKLNARKAYDETFVRLRDMLANGRALNAEAHKMLLSSFRMLNAEFGFSLQLPDAPDLARPELDLNAVERTHAHFFSTTNAFRLMQREFVDRLMRALAVRLQDVFEAAVEEVERWNTAAITQLDAHYQSRRSALTKRLDSFDRIQNATDTLEERIAQLSRQNEDIKEIGTQLAAQIASLAQLHESSGQDVRVSNPSGVM